MKVKMKYNILSFLFFIAGCCIGGFIAVFLQYKNVSNTLIGVVTGSGCIASIFLTPYVSSLLNKVKNLNVKKLMIITYLILAVGYALISLINFPPLFVMLVFMALYALYLSTGPFLQLLATDYMRIGEEVNFGLARGLGSTAWAVGALGLGFLVEKFDPRILCICFLIATTLMILMLLTMPTVEPMPTTDKKSGNPFVVSRRYPIFFTVLVGFSLLLAAASSLSTYLINIVTNLGGDTSFYGVAVFLMALSEMPVMALVPSLMKKLKTTTLILIAGCCYLLRNFIICLAPNLVVLCLGMACQGLSFGLLTTVVTYYVIFNLEPKDQVMGQTLIIMMTSGFGAMIGNLLGGVLQDTFGLNGMYVFVYILTIFGTATIVFAFYKSKQAAYCSEIKR